jgi:hypothetical protein
MSIWRPLWQNFQDTVNLIAALDHSGRAGNYFFQSVFDQHPEVLTCPWVQYTYSYFTTKFEDSSVVSAQEVHSYWTQKSYFKLIYNEAVGDISALITSFGSDPKAIIDREKTREIFDTIVLEQATITRRQLILASYFAFAIGVGRDPLTIKYILVSDAVSLRSEDVMLGFAGTIINLMKSDFPELLLISLERDPRATFASCRQQYVNSNGNMYNLHINNFLKQFYDLIRSKFTQDGSIHLYWLLYFASAARLMYQLKSSNSKNLLTVKNEDLNLNFADTMSTICNWLQVDYLNEWKNIPYKPTNVGKEWLGKGAYNSRYQKNQYGMLQNDPDEVAKNITGPNKYVTERWKSRLPKNEIGLIEFLFKDELNDLNYEYLVNKDRSLLKFILNLCCPFQGELPNAIWLKGLVKGSFFQAVDRIFYCCTFWIFYIISRYKLARIALSTEHFSLK